MKPSASKEWITYYQREPTQAWQSFLLTYHQLIMAVVRKLVTDHDSVMELYTHTIGKLRDNDCKKLTAYFSKARFYSFETWIAVVVRNGCMDWFRKQEGRMRLSKSVQALPPEDQLIFKYVYGHGYSYEMTYEALKARHHSTLSLEEMSRRVARIDDLVRRDLHLNPEQGLRNLLRTAPLDETAIDGSSPLNERYGAGVDLNPEEEIIHNESSQILQDVLSKLPPDQRLLIRLHYYEKLTLQEIARIMKMKNLWRVHRKMQKTLETLNKELRQRGIGPSDLHLL